MTKEIEKMLADFIYSIDNELEISFYENEGWSFETSTNTINVDINDLNDCGFIRHLKEFHKCEYAENFSLILWSMLHEIGHYETESLVDSESEFEERIALFLTDTTTNVVIQNRYFNLPSEFEATEWAIWWIENNLDKAVNFNRLLDLI